tara:strand:- start:325 stop:576 length:252 start_codon:yes stop_codon:yes gene_type:complete
MKNIKDITITIFAVIGFFVIITAFTTNEVNEAQQNGNWVLQLDGGSSGSGYFYNTFTGEIKAVKSNSGEMRYTKLKFRVIDPE